MSHTDPVLALCVLHDGTLASGSADKTIKLWDPINNQLIRTLAGHKTRVFALVELPDGRLAASTYRKIIIWK